MSKCQCCNSVVSVTQFIYFGADMRCQELRADTITGYTDNGNEPNYNGPYLIRIRGLPWSTTKQDILDFFDGVHILNGEDGIHLITLPMLPSRPLGEAYIQLASERDLDLAHTFDRKNLGSRYIEGESMLLVSGESKIISLSTIYFSVQRPR